MLALAFPVGCKVCGSEVTTSGDGVACSSCWSSTRIFSGREMLCRKCGAFFGPEAAPVEVSCHQCDDHHYEKASAVGIYEKALAASIIRLKSDPVIPARMDRFLLDALSKIDLSKIGLVIPIPLSKQRLIERGYNQAEVIARHVSRHTYIPADTASLARRSHSPIHRVGMDKRARELTVLNAFEVVRPKLIEGQKILLVDDVLTSGSTASYCSKALKKAGADKVHVFTLARAVMQ